MNLLAPYTKSLAAYGPGDPGLSHTDAERVAIRELGVAVTTYVYAVQDLLAKHEANPKQLPSR